LGCSSIFLGSFLDVVDLEISDEVLNLSLVVFVEVGDQVFADLGDAIDGGFCLIEVFVDLPGRYIGLESEFLPGDAGELLDDDGEELFDLKRLVLSVLHFGVMSCDVDGVEKGSVKFVGWKGGKIRQISTMALNNKDQEVHQMAKDLADRLGVSLTEAVRIALRDMIRQHESEASRGRRLAAARQIVLSIREQIGSLPTMEEIDRGLYDERGLPR
jgi:antitoxin VapB